MRRSSKGEDMRNKQERGLGPELWRVYQGYIEGFSVEQTWSKSGSSKIILEVVRNLDWSGELEIS